jgi:hypothetical protein
MAEAIRDADKLGRECQRKHGISAKLKRRRTICAAESTTVARGKA